MLDLSLSYCILGIFSIVYLYYSKCLSIIRFLFCSIPFICLGSYFYFC